MKRIDDLSKAEVLALTGESIEALVELECALNGVPLLPAEPIKPHTQKYENDLQIYRIGETVFVNAEDANSIITAYSKVSVYKKGYDDTFLKPMAGDDYNYPKIKKEIIMSREYYNKISVEKKAADAEIGTYEKLKKEYDVIFSQQKEHDERVKSIVTEVLDQKHIKDRYKMEFERYLRLSDNNHTIAWNFLKNAHYDVENIEGLFDELMAV